MKYRIPLAQAYAAIAAYSAIWLSLGYLFTH